MAELTIKDIMRAEKGGATKMAEEFGISRPTMYAYMNAYGTSREGTIPENIRAFFHEKMNDIETLTYVSGVFARMIRRYNARLIVEKDELSQMKESLRRADENDYDPDNPKILRKLLDNLYTPKDVEEQERSISSIERLVREMEEKQSDCEAKIRDLAAKGVEFTTQVFIDGNRIMVVYNRDPKEGVEYTLRLYVDFIGKKILIGTYHLAENSNHFLIDDVVVNAPLYYEVTQRTSSLHGDRFLKTSITEIKEGSVSVGEVLLDP